MRSLREGDTLLDEEGTPMEGITCLYKGYAATAGDDGMILVLEGEGGVVASTNVSKEAFQRIVESF